MHRLVQRHAATGGRVLKAERGGGQHAERAGQHRRAVGQDVAEQIVGDDHVELLRVAHQLHRAVVGIHVVQFDALAFGLMQLGHRLAPQHAGMHDIGLLDRMHLATALAREVEADAGHALDLRRRIDLGIDRLLGAVRQGLHAARLAEIHTTGQLAQDQDVQPLDQLALQRRGVGQRREHDGRAQIGEQVHFLAQAQQAALRLLLERQIVPFRAADGAEQHGVNRQRVGHGLVGQRGAVRVQRRTAHQAFLNVEGDVAALVHPVHHAADLAHHLRPDTVTRQDQQFLVRCHSIFPFFGSDQAAIQGWERASFSS